MVLERDENIVMVSPSDLNSPSLCSFLLQKSFAIPYQERKNLLHVKQEDMHVHSSLHASLLEAQV